MSHRRLLRKEGLSTFAPVKGNNKETEEKIECFATSAKRRPAIRVVADSSIKYNGMTKVMLVLHLGI